MDYMGPTWPNLGRRCAPDSFILLNIGPTKANRQRQRQRRQRQGERERARQRQRPTETETEKETTETGDPTWVRAEGGARWRTRFRLQRLSRLSAKTRKRTSQDSCIPHSHEKAQGKAHPLLFSFLSESFSCCCRSGVARHRIELWFSFGDTKQVRTKFSLSTETCEASQGVRVAGLSDALARGEAELCSGKTK